MQCLNLVKFTDTTEALNLSCISVKLKKRRKLPRVTHGPTDLDPIFIPSGSTVLGSQASNRQLDVNEKLAGEAALDSSRLCALGA
jgi:hypothetical protein